MSNSVLVHKGESLNVRRIGNVAMIVEAFWHLVIFETLAGATNFGRIQRWVRLSSKLSRAAVPNAALQEVRDAVNEACTYYPKTVACLQRSTTIARMLRKRGIPAEVVIGVQFFPFASHAWVEFEGVVVNDKARVKEAYQELHRI